MKKYLLLLLILPFIFLNNVKADSTDTAVYSANEDIISHIYNTLLNHYDNSQYPYYGVFFQYQDLDSEYKVKENSSLSNITGLLYYLSSDNTNDDVGRIWVRYSCYTGCEYEIVQELKGDNFYGSLNTDYFSLTNSFRLYAGNLTYNNNNPDYYYLNHVVPHYTSVDLDNYEYVLLSLKDYSISKPFVTELQVKGSIGITEIYNYGRTKKEDILGVGSTDRCVSNRSNFTSERLFILDSALQNNAIYAIKECNSEGGSSFKFDNTVFDITYVTEENADDPVVTINGTSYHTIPYSDLPSTATKNEEENYIPGQSENIVTGNSVGLSAIVKNAQKSLSDIWSIFTYFMQFVNQIFSVLPTELRSVLVASFSIGCILGVLKIIKS